MPKTKISEFSATPANNTDIDSINIAEGCAPSGINDAIRELMAQLKDFQTGAVGDSFNGPIGTSTAAAGAFTTISATGAITSTLATGTAPLVIASTTKVANLNVDSLDGADWAAPAALGSTTPAAVSATTLTTSSTVTHNGGTANGVTYLNGSKVLTSGSALTFDGSKVEVSNGTFRASNTSGWYTNLTATGLTNFSTTMDFDSVGSYLFKIATAEQMRLTSTGLGIGTSSPANPTGGKGFEISNASGASIRATNSATYLELQSGGSANYILSNGAYPLLFYTNGSERMRLPAAGGVQAVTTISVGNATPSSSGAGITFPATQSASSNANTLDDYEEGTWTPVIDSDTNGSGRATTVSSANYTKIGNTVFIQCYISLATLGTGGSGGLVLLGLPFTAKAGSYYSSLSVGYATGLNSNLSSIGIYTADNTTKCYINGANAVSSSPLDNLTFSTYAKAGMALIVSGCYQV